MYCHEDAGEKIFGVTEVECKTGNKHKEEDEIRRKMDEADRNNIAEQLQKHSQYLNVKSTDLYNIVNGQVAQVNVQDVLHIGEKFAALLPGAFYSNIERKVKTMQDMKKVVIMNGKAIFDIETLFVRLPVIGQHRGLEVTDIFQYEPRRVPSSFIDEFGCLRKGDKTVSVKWIGVPGTSAPALDASCCTMLSGLSLGQAGDLALSFGVRLSLILQKSKNWCCLTAIMRMSQLRNTTRG